MQVVPRADAVEVVQSMLHTICFVRMLGLLTPETREVKGVRMVRVGD